MGVNIPDNKASFIGLSYLYGVGKPAALRILGQAKIDPNKKIGKLTDDEISKLVAIIEKNYVVEGALRRSIQENIQRLIRITCYRGSRHKLGLPVRGQRTRSNARTRKGKRKTVAGKKEAPSPK